VLHKKNIKYIVATTGLLAIYWIPKYQEIKEMLGSTQIASVTGGGFGLKLFFDLRIDSTYLAFASFITTFLLISLFNLLKKSKIDISAWRADEQTPRILMFLGTYFFIWAVGQSFMYRLVILIPVLVCIGISESYNNKINRILIVAILVTLFTARLPVTVPATGALALFSAYLLLTETRFHFRHL
jgi:hypothetical protein